MEARSSATTASAACARGSGLKWGVESCGLCSKQLFLTPVIALAAFTISESPRCFCNMWLLLHHC